MTELSEMVLLTSKHGRKALKHHIVSIESYAVHVRALMREIE